uniref:Uncharacterized protein n=1 Tax=Arundo donax TaxID=35708 RepID=A0A0A9HG78_ARUDO
MYIDPSAPKTQTKKYWSTVHSVKWLNQFYKPHVLYQHETNYSTPFRLPF